MNNIRLFFVDQKDRDFSVNNFLDLLPKLY